MAKVFFDLDGTLIRGQSQLFLIRFLYKKGLIGSLDFLIIFGWFAGYQINFFRQPEFILNFALKNIKGKNESEVRKIIDNFYKEELEERLNMEIVDELLRHQKLKNEIYLLTNTIKPIAKVVAENLGIKHVISTEMEIINGIYTGKLDGRILYGKEKARAVKMLFSENELLGSYAYADHPSDLELLQLVNHPIFINTERKLFR